MLCNCLEMSNNKPCFSCVDKITSQIADDDTTDYTITFVISIIVISYMTRKLTSMQIISDGITRLANKINIIA